MTVASGGGGRFAHQGKQKNDADEQNLSSRKTSAMAGSWLDGNKIGKVAIVDRAISLFLDGMSAEK